MASPYIRRLSIQRFRGLQSVAWRPAPKTNVILGGGNVGKSTVLDAIALLLHPSNAFTLSDADYWQRKVEDEFVIEAVMYLPETTGIQSQRTTAWPWEWDGTDAVLPPDDGNDIPRQPVHKLRVRGTADLELVHEIVQPDGSAIGLSVGLRRGIGVVRLAGDDRSDRDLRLVHGSALDRLLDDKALRAKLGRKVAINAIEGDLSAEARQRLTSLGTTFRDRALPQGLGLGFVGSAGISINALVGLTASKDDVPLPITSWGAATRRLAALAIADALQQGTPVVVVDELERGLEPYSQRALARDLQAKPSQCFLTTHSPSVLASADQAALWYMDASGNIGDVAAAKVAKHRAKDPEAFLSRLTIVAEGASEVGFLAELVTRYVDRDWRERGLYVTDGGGNEAVLNLLEGLASGGLRFAGFADREAGNPNPARWQRLHDGLGDLLFRWADGCLERNVLPLFDLAQLDQLISDAENRRTGQRRRSLADRLGIAETTTEAIRAAAGDRLMDVMVEAATGSVPNSVTTEEQRGAYKGHAKQWFKSLDGGREMATKAITLGAWPALWPVLRPLLNALRAHVGKEPLPTDTP